MNRKKGRDTTVDINDSNKGDPVKIFIVQVAARSCTATQVPESTAAIQSFLNAGFRNAAQVEFVVMIGSLHPITKATGFRVSGILFLNMLLAVIVDETRNSLWNVTMIRRRRAQRSCALVRRGGESASGHHRRDQNTDPSVAKALHRAAARGGWPHGVRSGRD
jgi:hypothetical protein